MLPSLIFIPLIFGITSDSSWQTTFCTISVLNDLDFLQCDQLQDNLTFEAGTNMVIDAIPETDTVKYDANAVAIITSNDTTYSTKGGTFTATPTLNHLWITSDGSIFIEFINYTGGIQ